jgi:hypothetical protein
MLKRWCVRGRQGYVQLIRYTPTIICVYPSVHEVAKKESAVGLAYIQIHPFNSVILKGQAHVHFADDVQVHAVRRSDGDGEDDGDVVAYFPRQLTDFLA